MGSNPIDRAKLVPEREFNFARRSEQSVLFALGFECRNDVSLASETVRQGRENL